MYASIKGKFRPNNDNSGKTFFLSFSVSNLILFSESAAAMKTPGFC